MRILNVTQSYGPFFEFGGPPVKVGALARGLAARGHEVTVLTADWGFEKRIKASDATGAERSPFGWRTVKDAVTTIYLPTRFRYRALSWNPAVRKFCRTQLQNFEIAHIFGLYDFLGPAVATECEKRNIPYVLEPIGMFVPIVRSLWLKRLYHRVYGKRLFNKASRIIATSEQESQELAGGGVTRGKIVLRRNGVERPESWPARGSFRQKLGIAEDEKLVLFLGRLSEKKSPDLLLRAFASLAKESSMGRLRLIFAGPGEEEMRGRLEQMAVELGVKRSVEFTGGIFGEEKWAAYRDADVFVLPSQNENFGNTAAEAAAAGTPVVVTEQCGIAPLLANVAGIVAPHEAGALAEAIRWVLSDSTLRERLVAGGREVVSRLGWELPIREMEILYSQLATERGGGSIS
ncbi:MAG TPA: glycosyltransferase [Candidatus Methylomirabilis sp.]|nr:glycosyltransferase [Candidatus Methylomirabilis sp.]